MSNLTIAQRIVGYASALLGISQSIAWFIMSLLCIIEYNKNNPPKDISTYGDWVDYYIYVKYLYKDGTVPTGTIITPTAFSVFMWLYLVIDVLWFINSIILFLRIRGDARTLPSISFNWGLVTACICCVDLVLVILIGYDYDQICMKQKSDFGTQEICTNAMIPVLILAARGFVLWMLNLVFAYLAFVMALHLTRDANEARNPVPVPRPKSVTLPKKKNGIPIPRATLQRSESLYQQQVQNLNTPNTWNVNLSTAYDIRAPPKSPRTPLSINSRQQHFFDK